mgnify:CR=1 FL=1
MICLKNLGTKELKTERLILRKFTINDAKDMYNNYGSDSKVSKYLAWNTHQSIKDSILYIKGVLKQYKSDSTYCWGVFLKPDNVLIGAISVIDLDVKNQTAEIGYCYGSKWWGNGYATESFKRVIQFLFDEVSVETIYADHCLSNLASGKVMEKCGLKKEGILRKRMYDKEGILNDLVSYSILKGEYLNEKIK